MFRRSTKLSTSTDQSYEEEVLMCKTLTTFFSRLLESKGGGEPHPLIVPALESSKTPSSQGSASPDTSPG